LACAVPQRPKSLSEAFELLRTSIGGRLLGVRHLLARPGKLCGTIDIIDRE
jgi:hypothetical protein